MSQSTELWKPVVGYEGYYEVSDHGRVKSCARTVIRSNGRPLNLKERILRPGTMPKGHLQVSLRLNKESKTHTVHSLVLLAFVGPRPEGHLCRHLNGVPGDNRVENLAWGTGSENQYDAVEHGSHYLAGKRECSRGHLLEHPNLASGGSQGRRVCRACNREHDDSKWAGRDFSAAKADARYADVLAGRRRHKSEMRF